MNILLSATTHKLQLTTSSAANIDVVASYMDASNDNPPVVQGDTSGTQTTTIASAGATTDIVAAPAASTHRNVKAMFIRNRHASTSCDVTVIFDNNGTDYEMHKATLTAGSCLEFVEGIGFYTLATATTTELFKVLDATATGTDGNSAQPWFPTAGAVTVEAGARYRFEGLLYTTRAAGAVSHTTGLGFGGTATITDFLGRYWCGEGDVATLADDDSIVATTVSNLQVKAASTSTTEVIKVFVTGTVTINAAGTFIPQFTYSAAPGGAPSILRGTRFHMWKYTNTTLGSWA